MFVVVIFSVFIVIFLATATITLLGLIKKVNIEDRYLDRLFVVLILEVVGAVIGLFGSADFFGTNAADFIADLPQEVRADSVEATRGKIARVVEERQQYSDQRAKLQQQVNELQSKLTKLWTIPVEKQL